MRSTPKYIRNAFRACRRICCYRDIPIYRRHAWLARKKLDGLALCLAIRTPDFWFAALIVLAGVLLANILCWRFDLVGWQRDLLKALPVLLAAPGVAALRRRLIVRLMRARDPGR